MFDKFLNAGLIPIGGDDDKRTKLLAAADELSKLLLKDKAKIISYTLVALDDHISPDETVLKEVEGIVTKHWKLIRSQFTEMPIQIYRAIIFEALDLAIIEGTDYENIVWLTSGSIYKHLEFSPKEELIIKEFITKCADLAEDNALTEWTIDKSSNELKIDKIKIAAGKIASKIDLNGFKEKMTALAYNVPNHGQISHITFTEWNKNFISQSSDCIINEFENILKLQDTSINNSLASFEKQVNSYFTDLLTNISSEFKSAIQSSVAVERRSQLLWWKETLYSRKLKRSYRGLSDFQCSIAIAFDLFEMLPNICPVSVDFILKETYNLIFKDSLKVSLKAFLNQIKDKKNKDFLTQFFSPTQESNQRIDLVSYLSELIFNTIDVENGIYNKIGIHLEQELKYEDISVWLLHCLLAGRLTK